MLKSSGLTNRFILSILIGIVLLFFFNTRNYDLHFTLRGAQSVSTDIVIAHIPAEPSEISIALSELSSHNPQLLVAPASRRVATLLSDYGSVFVIPRKTLKPDSDGKMRTLNLPKSLTAKVDNLSDFNKKFEISFINFRGPKNTFSSIYFYELKNKTVLPSVIQNKMVILDIQGAEDEPLSTPIGDLSPAELLANMFDNVLLSRWITPLPIWASLLILFIISTYVAVLILRFSANLAFLGIFILLLIISSFGFLLFDHFYIWIPLTAFIIHTFVVYFIFINFKLNKKEQIAWQLEKEKIYQTEMDEMKKNFLNLFSHDLKTPIAKILAQIELMDGSDLSLHKIKEGIYKIRRYSNELNQYVKNILKISQIESNRFQLKFEPCDLNSVIQTAIQNLKPLAEEKNIQILDDLEPLFSINCDKELVQQIILNIIENAVKYSPENTKVVVHSSEDEDYVVIAVEDQGRGIKPEEQKSIWQKFSRLQDQGEGTGLGLYLVKYFVEAHRGSVFVESEINKGSKIGFKLPLK